MSLYLLNRSLRCAASLILLSSGYLLVDMGIPTPRITCPPVDFLLTPDISFLLRPDNQPLTNPRRNSLSRLPISLDRAHRQPGCVSSPCMIETPDVEF